MTQMIQFIHKFENKFDTKAEQFAHRHPYLLFLALFIGMPIFILAAVCISTVVAMLPISLLCGWL